MTSEEAEILAEADASLKAARVLLNEGFEDYAASRAYYAMFYAAQALLSRDGLAFSRHSAVIAAVGERFARTGRLDPRLHKYLVKGFETRNAADYIPGSSLSFEEADEQLRNAAEFIDAARLLLP